MRKMFLDLNGKHFISIYTGELPISKVNEAEKMYQSRLNEKFVLRELFFGWMYYFV